MSSVEGEGPALSRLARATKIVATLGPATSGPERVAALIAAGVDVVRLNFSHGSYDDHRERIALVRRAAADLRAPVAILQDLQGPKIRTGSLVDEKPVELAAGRTFRIAVDEYAGDSRGVSTTHAALPHDVNVGDRILLSDGHIELRVVDKSKAEVITEVVRGGILKERQGINLPGLKVSAPGITEKDIEDLRFGLSHDVDYVALSFVRAPEDVQRVRGLIADAGRDTPVIAKIERPEALDAIAEILDEAQGIMVARGDLGVELSPEKVPLVQKQLIELANARGKPVITATQMLESMIESPRPTRAEVSDVANAILDGSDAVMLSGETAVGRHPIEAVETMVRIAEEIQAHKRNERRGTGTNGSLPAVSTSPEAIGAAVDAIVKTLPEVDAVWVLTQSGNSARLISLHRPEVPIVAFTPNQPVYRRMALLWGVTPVKTAMATAKQELEREVQALALAQGLAQPGDTVVITGSHPFHRAAPTNFLKIQRVGGDPHG